VLLESLALIGNCQASALISDAGEVVWCCLPRFDSEPLFGRLLDGAAGTFQVGPVGGGRGTSRYLPNTNVLETVFTTKEGSFAVLDFFPRFEQHARTFRPPQLFRVLRPLSGTPSVTVRCAPTLGWSKQPAPATAGSHHLRFEGFSSQLRLTTDLPLSMLDGRPIALTGVQVLALTWGTPIEEPLLPLAQRFLTETTREWELWVKHCDIPPAYQAEVIRSALALKLHVYEDTGAIVAAMTTSVPEAPDKSGRTWDYRYCWLRDASYALDAFRLLGHFEEREAFVRYLLNLSAAAPDLSLQPLYRVDGRGDIPEWQVPGWEGFEGHGPVREGNGAATHLQHDIYGEVVLALAPLFLDERFRDARSHESARLLEALALRGAALAGTPDAGIWEYRTEMVPQSFSTLMCWAGADRAARALEATHPSAAARLQEHEVRLHQMLLSQCYSEDLGSFVGTHGGRTLDAAMLQAVRLRALPVDDARLRSTVAVLSRELDLHGWTRRYKHDDGFGEPTVAFLLCTFWRVEALALLGQREEARALLKLALGAASPLGLLSEDTSPQTGRLWGNFPQAYSHVGLIHSAFATSPRWADVL
jgi:GH15 family glucan-1,4-alpha-glucosidase